jgi:hypothetical protein
MMIPFGIEGKETAVENVAAEEEELVVGKCE